MRSGAFGANVATTAWSVPMVTVHGLVVQAPLQPMKTEPGAATAVSVTTVPETNADAHAVGQAMPAGALATDPAPAPCRVTVSVYEAGVTVNERETSGAAV